MLVERIADSFFSEGIIAEEEKEIVCFGLESLEANLLGFALTLGIGICFKQIGEALLLWLLLFPLRKNAGGYHAVTKTRCFLMSALMLASAFLFFGTFERTMIFYGICTMIAGCVIWILAPVENPSKELNVLEHKVYRKRTRIVLGTEGIIFAIVLCCKWEMAVQSICMTFFIVAISLLMGILKLVSRV